MHISSHLSLPSLFFAGLKATPPMDDGENGFYSVPLTLTMRLFFTIDFVFLLPLGDKTACFRQELLPYLLSELVAAVLEY
jgi:hypothetical protein